MRTLSGWWDALRAAHDDLKYLGVERGTVVGYGVAELKDGDGRTILLRPFTNLVTDTGDAYHVAKIIAAIPPASPSAPTALTGMQIGSGGTAVSKSGAGSAMVTLLAGQAFDATYPQSANLGGGLGVNAVYRTTYAAGVGTGSVTEATQTNGTIGTASNAGNTIARLLFTAIPKGAADSLAITWNVKQLGS